MTAAAASGRRVPSSTSRPRSDAVSAGAFAGGAPGVPGAGGRARGRNFCVKVIVTGTGLPPYRPGSKRKPRAAAITASSNGGAGGVTSSVFVTAPVPSIISLTVTETGASIGGAAAG